MEEDNVTPPTRDGNENITNVPAYITSLASVAAIIDITVNSMKAINGDGIELIGRDSRELTSEQLHDLVSTFVYRAVNDKAISHDVIQGSID